ncbi:hypothetical protein [Nocardioides sp. Leaf374]|uniref:hypothetical protein n=1 Tax=Nocardioides sp. Leaf374 TaxID=2876560 RepID=UPI001E2CDAF6|nr:hypothetical protein [Nocardioides sp. Leaf374]
MRRLLMLVPAALLAPLLAVAGHVGPAQGGETFIRPTHGLDPDDWSLRRLDCDLVEADTTRVGLTAGPATSGQGSLLVEGTADSLGGVVRHRSGSLPSVSVVVMGAGGGEDAPEGVAPQGVWWVEAGGVTYTSDPVDLGDGVFERVHLDAAVLHGPDFTGSVRDVPGNQDDWTAGLLTGGCVRSPTARLDVFFWKKSRFGDDLEPSDWLRLDHVADVGDPPPVGSRFTLRARALHAGLLTGVVTPVDGARVHFRRVLTDGAVRTTSEQRANARGWVTLRRTADQSATWRARRDRSGGRPDVVSPAHDVYAALALSRPRLDGTPCPGVRACEDMTVDGPRVVVSGTLAPPRGRVEVHVTPVDGDPTVHMVRPGPRQRWRTAFSLPAGRYHVFVDALSTSPEYVDANAWWLDLRVR